MKVKMLVVLAMLLLLVVYETTGAMKIEGGKLEDVIVVGSGASDSTVVTKFTDGWDPEGPRSFDIDKDGNIYILDHLGGKVLKFNKDGKWMLTFQVAPRGWKPKQGQKLKDLTVDNWGNVYVIQGGFIGKFSPEGKFLLQIPRKEDMKGHYRGHGIYWLVLTDKSGRVYSFGDQHHGGLVTYAPKGEFIDVINRCEYEYEDRGVIQREVGNDIYFRKSKYLMRTSLEEYTDCNIADTVAILPDWIRLIKFADYKAREIGWIEFPFSLIGFDKNNCFYFEQCEGLYGRGRSVCETYRIVKFHLKDNELIENGDVEIVFEKGKEECTDKELWIFYKQFVVTGDGTIYWLRGTVDTVKVSKIIMD